MKPWHLTRPSAGPCLVVVLAIAAWALAKQLFALPDFVLPSPWQVGEAFLHQPGVLWRGMLETALIATLGFLLAALLGVLIASLLSLSPVVQRSVYPLTLLFQMVPLVAIAPLLVIWFGYGRPAILASAVVVAIFPVIASTLSGLRSRDRGLDELFTVLAASHTERWWKLALPSAVPSLVTGLRIAAGLATIGTITGEFLAGVAGEHAPLGVLITSALKNFQTAQVFACVLLAALVGFALFFLVAATSRSLLARWMPNA